VFGSEREGATLGHVGGGASLFVLQSVNLWIEKWGMFWALHLHGFGGNINRYELSVEKSQTNRPKIRSDFK